MKFIENSLENPHEQQRLDSLFPATSGDKKKKKMAFCRLLKLLPKNPLLKISFAHFPGVSSHELRGYSHFSIWALARSSVHRQLSQVSAATSRMQPSPRLLPLCISRSATVGGCKTPKSSQNHSGTWYQAKLAIRKCQPPISMLSANLSGIYFGLNSSQRRMGVMLWKFIQHCTRILDVKSHQKTKAHSKQNRLRQVDF